jgi:hypothetical protein
VKTAKHHRGIGRLLILTIVATVMYLSAAAPADAGVAAGRADIEVWVENAGFVHPSYDDVVISVRAARGCFATVAVIDTDGFLHVVHPFSPNDNAWLNQGVTYRFSGNELGLGVLRGRGIAHVFAIGSPYPFDFASFGDAVFVGRFGYRVYGDPYLAGYEFSMRLLPGEYARNFVGVSFARFYVREWCRYPVYLCHGFHSETVHVRTGGYCRQCSRVYDRYRVHVNDPRVAMQPPKYKDTQVASDEMTRIRIKKIERGSGTGSVVRKPEVRYETSAKIVSARRTGSRLGTGSNTVFATTTRVTGAKRRATAEKSRLVNEYSTRNNDSGQNGVTTSSHRTSDVHYKAKAKKGRVSR